jgi:hypothetical protein
VGEGLCRKCGGMQMWLPRLTGSTANIFVSLFYRAKDSPSDNSPILDFLSRPVRYPNICCNAGEDCTCLEFGAHSYATVTGEDRDSD